MIKRSLFVLLSLAVLLSSCTSYQQFGAVATGSSLGGMLGSSIGGLAGGYRGHVRGTIAGMIIGGAVGAAVTAPSEDRTSKKMGRAKDAAGEVGRVQDMDDDVYSGSSYSDDEVQYGTYNSPSYQSPAATTSDLDYIEVANVHFLDDNNNQALDRDEEAFLVMEIYNRGDKTLYNVTPQITCSSKRVLISPAATVNRMEPGVGIRYKAGVKPYRRIGDDYVTFTVSFSNGMQQVVAKTFRIRIGQ